MKLNLIKFAINLALISCIGCTSAHKKYYTQRSPSKFPKTATAKLFTYKNIDLKNVYEKHFSDYLIVGISDFWGPYQKDSKALIQAKNVGADIVLTNYSYRGSQTSNIPMNLPSTSTSFHNGTVNSFDSYSASRYTFSGTTTTLGTQTINIPVTTHSYEQQAYYLKNVHSIKPAWTYTIDDFKIDGAISQTVSSDNYCLKEYVIGRETIAFVERASGKINTFRPGDLKYRYDNNTGKGILLYGDKSPAEAFFKTNKFGHLEIVTEYNDVFNLSK